MKQISGTHKDHTHTQMSGLLSSWGLPNDIMLSQLLVHILNVKNVKNVFNPVRAWILVPTSIVRTCTHIKINSAVVRLLGSKVEIVVKVS